METQVLLGPDNYDRIKGCRIYEVTCDDPGLSKPAYLATKNAEHPDAAEVAALDRYIDTFVWGGLQRTTQEASKTTGVRIRLVWASVPCRESGRCHPTAGGLWWL
ncbi:hypothetical protein [Bradyrhizobium cosmicum]|uniref:hypothetical protein n=1 Tax=Bradyrhizobium cosmicum TaxID=1404864 RepID=UPI0028E35030|nr:hypothetical protein [Bradyrhizobium cosmicum]